MLILILLVQGAMILALLRIDRKTRRIIMNQTELAQALADLGAQLTKALDEIVAAIAAGGQTTPEVDAALANARAVAQSLDDLNPDGPAKP
jgi:ABC-type transporter Mla subunit MlaD